MLSASAQPERILRGGTTNRGLVSRVGDTVRRPPRPTSESTKALLGHLEQVGFTGAPRHLGFDDRGREVLSYIPGQAAVAPLAPWAFTDDALVSVAELLRRFHDALDGFDASRHRWPHPIPARFQSGIVSHNDPNLDNVIFRDGRAVALIDFDLASPGSAAWDLACAARLWVPLRAPDDAPQALRERALQRLSLFVDGYGASREQRIGLVEALPHCHEWCYAIVGQAIAGGHKPFSRQWSRGGRRRAERTSRWLATHEPEIRGALGALRS